MCDLGKSFCLSAKWSDYSNWRLIPFGSKIWWCVNFFRHTYSTIMDIKGWVLVDFERQGSTLQNKVISGNSASDCVFLAPQVTSLRQRARVSSFTRWNESTGESVWARPNSCRRLINAFTWLCSCTAEDNGWRPWKRKVCSQIFTLYWRSSDRPSLRQYLIP